MEEQDKSPLDRRSFLKAAATSGAALVGAQALGAQQAEAAPAAQAEPAAVVQVLGEDRFGSDFMMDVLKPLGFDYVTINPHSDSGGLQESMINYTGNTSPELITCLHEEIAVAMAHGFFKIEGKPLAALIYSSVGLQARGDGRLQRVLRPGARVFAAGKQDCRSQLTQRAGSDRHGPRLHQVG